MNLEGRELVEIGPADLKPVDRWIYHRLNDTVRDVRAAMAAYRFNDGAQLCYEFFWNDFCDWYIEASKLSLYSGDQDEQNRAMTLLVSVLEESMRLLHPFMSFITEEIYGKLPAIPGQTRAEALIVASYPEETDARSHPDTAAAFASLQELVRSVRPLRSEFTIPPAQRVRFSVRAEADFAHTAFFAEHADLIELLATAEQTGYGTDAPDRTGSVTLVGNGFEVYVYVRDAIDLDREVAKLRKELEKTERLLGQSEKKLENQGFLQNAGEEVIEKERGKLAEFSGKVEKIRAYLAELG
jgi:valyl-tRNA synthetase